MKILVLGGTLFMGKHLVNELLSKGYDVTIATRGNTKDSFGDKVKRIKLDRTSKESIENALTGMSFDIIFDSLAYSSNEVKYLLDVVKCERYIQTSTGSVYVGRGFETKEDFFIAENKELVYCDRTDFSYGEVKQNAEAAIVQDYSHIPAVRMRIPFVIGEDDYTDRLYFYVEHIINKKPINVTNMDARIAFINSEEAGKFLCFLGESDYVGPINGNSKGTKSIREVSDYVKSKTGKEIIINENGDAAPYNYVTDFNLSTEKASEIGFDFSELDSWFFLLLDAYIKRASL